MARACLGATDPDEPEPQSRGLLFSAAHPTFHHHKYPLLSESERERGAKSYCVRTCDKKRQSRRTSVCRDSGRREGEEAKAESRRVMLACRLSVRPAIGEINQNTKLQHDPPSLAWFDMGRGICSCFQRLLVGQSEWPGTNITTCAKLTISQMVSGLF